VGEWRGIKFVNSSIDTTPNRCVSTLSSLNTAAVVILGGRGKGVPFTPIKEPLSKIGRAAVIFGECGEEIISSLPDGLPYRKVANMEAAVRVGAELAHYGDTVILSPAATSFDNYKNFEERGEQFNFLINKYWHN
jgi:UDP-N-acetylmuramoylalanine--D-glutamate ligase